MSRVIAIDGPAASGKSSTAAAVANTLGALHLDSGALYRGLTRVALDEGTADPHRVLAAADRRQLVLRLDGAEIAPYLDGAPAERLIRTPEVTARVSEIAAMGPCRDWVNIRLRAAAAGDRVLVLDGRDIGTAVFPDARLKVFLTASPASRARRRLAQRGAVFDAQSLAQETSALAIRDALDAGRAMAPLRQAADAVVVDTSNLTFRAQVDIIVALAAKALS